jgi:hypothetical protein
MSQQWGQLDNALRLFCQRATGPFGSLRWLSGWLPRRQLAAVRFMLPSDDRDYRRRAVRASAIARKARKRRAQRERKLRSRFTSRQGPQTWSERISRKNETVLGPRSRLETPLVVPVVADNDKLARSILFQL